MREDPPCKGCTDRHPACHGKCEAYKEWLDRHHAQQKHLEDHRYRLEILGSDARDKVRWRYIK